jgi:hypothetical protein
LTANPRQGWLKEDFIDRPTPAQIFVKALYQDNPHGPKNYAETLEAAFSHRPDLLRAYRDGDWSSLSGVDQIILQEWVTAAVMRASRCHHVKKWISVDPARFGDDSCVILGGENTEIVAGRVLPYCSEPQIVAETESVAMEMGDQPGTDQRVPIIVEVVGVCGVGDYLAQHGRVVIEYGPAKAAADPDRYYNCRAEVWSRVGKWLSAGFFDPAGGIFTLPEPEDERLRPIWARVCEQLLWPWYDFRGQKVLVAAKEDIKAKHSGVSPDYGDAYVNGIAHLSELPVYEYRGGYRPAPSRYQFDRNAGPRPSAMTC